MHFGALAKQVGERSLPSKAQGHGKKDTHKDKQVLYNRSFADQETDALEEEMTGQRVQQHQHSYVERSFPDLGVFTWAYRHLHVPLSRVGLAWSQHLHQQNQPLIQDYSGPGTGINKYLLFLFIYLFLAAPSHGCFVGFLELWRAEVTLIVMHGLLTVAASLVANMGSKASVVVAHGLSWLLACGIFPDQGSNPCLLYRQVDSLPLGHQGSPKYLFFLKYSWFMVLC